MKFNLSLTAAWLIIIPAVCITSCSNNNTGIPYPDPAPDSIPKVFLPGGKMGKQQRIKAMSRQLFLPF